MRSPSLPWPSTFVLIFLAQFTFSPTYSWAVAPVMPSCGQKVTEFNTTYKNTYWGTWEVLDGQMCTSSLNAPCTITVGRQYSSAVIVESTALFDFSSLLKFLGIGFMAGYAAGTIKTTGTDTSVTQQCPQGNITCGMQVARKMLNITGWQIRRCGNGCTPSGSCKPEYNPYILQVPVTLDTTFAGKSAADVQTYTTCRERGTSPGVPTPCGLSYCPQRNDTEGLQLEGTASCTLNAGGQIVPTQSSQTSPYGPYASSPQGTTPPPSSRVKKRRWQDGLKWALRRDPEPEEDLQWMRHVIHLSEDGGPLQIHRA